MNQENKRKYIDITENLYYNRSNTNSTKKHKDFSYSVYLTMINRIKRNTYNTYLMESSAPYILGEDSLINNKHDKIFRTILSNKEEAGKFITKQLNLNTPILGGKLELYNSSFITNQFQNQEADIVYKIKDSNIFILIEHQTKVDYNMAYRVFNY